MSDRIQLITQYTSQLAEGASWGTGDCLMSVIRSVAWHFGVRYSVDEWSKMAKLPDDYESAHIVNHGQNTARRAGVLLKYAYFWTPERVAEKLRQARPVIVRVRYLKLPDRRFNYPDNWHFILVTGVHDNTFIYDDPYAVNHWEGEDRVITRAQLRTAMQYPNLTGPVGQVLYPATGKWPVR